MLDSDTNVTFKCDICQQLFKTETSFEFHKWTHRQYCTNCDILFKDSIALMDHNKKFHRSQIRERPKCETCHISFSNASNLKRHMKIFHNKITLHCCEICFSPFNCIQSLKAHKKIHTQVKRYECKICHSSTDSEYKLKVHNRIHTGEKLYKCNSCEKNYMYKQAADIHMKKCKRKVSA